MQMRFCFFFQAEDGIRDYKVTGVQMCALPLTHLQSQSVAAELHPRKKPANEQRPYGSDRIAGRPRRASRVALRQQSRRERYRRERLRNIVVTLLITLLPYPALAQKSTPPVPAQVAQEVRDYRMDNEDRIIRELSEFLSIPNIASDTPNIQKNVAHLVEMLEARGIETHLLPISGRGPVVFGKLITPEAKRTVTFYAHYDGQPVDPAAWTDGKPFEPFLRNASIEAAGRQSPFPGHTEQPLAPPPPDV